MPANVGAAELTIERQRARDGRLVPLKTRTARRTIEVRPALAAELRLSGGFECLGHGAAYNAFNRALGAAQLHDPQPTPHDLRHSHASKLIAGGWDPADVAARLGDRLPTVLSVYAHQFDTRRRSAERSASLERMYAEPAPVAMAGAVVQLKDG